MIDQSNAAAILYPELASKASPTTHKPEPASVAATSPEPAADLAESEDAADLMYPGDGSPPADGSYLPLIANVFDDLERRARLEGADNEVAAYSEGRHQVSAALHEFGVGAPAARELSTVIARFRETPATDGGIELANDFGHKHLREAWGRKYEQNLAHARAGYREAIGRLPWLKEELENGAGSDPAVIKHFAAIGRRLARKGK